MCIRDSCLSTSYYQATRAESVVNAGSRHRHLQQDRRGLIDQFTERETHRTVTDHESRVSFVNKHIIL